MRIVSTLMCGVGAATLLVAPTVTPVWAQERPVEPQTETLAVVTEAAEGAVVLPQDAVLGTQAAPADLVAVSPEAEVDDFALVGAVLPDDVEPGDVEVRVRQDDGWGPWQQLEGLDEGPDAGTAEYERAASVRATAPLWVGDADAVQTRVALDAGEDGEGVELSLVDPGTSPADGGAATPLASATAAAATAVPAIVTRAAWGADESLRCPTASYSSTVKAAVLHHTAGPNSYATPAEAVRQLRADYAYHTKTLGWCDLGYNFVVDKFGTVYEGRAGGIDRPVMGAHAGGFNKDTFGVSMLGDFRTVAPTPAMTQAVTDLVAWKLSLHDVNPWGQATLTSAGGGTARWASGTVKTLPAVMGHRDVGLTACPGDAGYAILPQVRDGALRASEAADFVRALYADLLGRAPAPAELDGWTKAVARSGDRWVGVKGFSGSEEFRRRFVTEAYVDVLGRQPDAGGLTGWVADIAAGRATLDDLRVRLMLSPEFYQRAGGTDPAFVESLYQRSLSRASTQGERTGWAGVVAQQGRATAVQGIWNSYESSLRRVDRSYARWLLRGASPTEQAYWSRTVVTAGDEAMREAAMVSPEYLGRARSRF